MARLSQVVRGDVDGVRAVWVPSRSSTMRASLVFRIGLADFALVELGWLHLLEHLALHGRGSVRCSVNGSVDLLTTTFDVAAEPEDASAFLAQVCDWLSNPDLSNLEHEADVLRAEAATRAKSVTARHLLWRYGANGPGVAGFDEFGLYRVDGQALRDAAARVFVRGNAMLAMNVAPPDGMRLGLPDGERLPPRPAESCEQACPAAFRDRIGGIAFSGVVPRSTAATLLTATLARELQTTIRDDAGSGYSAWSNYEVVDSDRAVVLAGSDVLKDRRGGIVMNAQLLVRRLADTGGDPKDLADQTATLVRHLLDADVQGQPWSCVRGELLNGTPFDLDEFQDEIVSTTVDDIAAAAQAFADSMLVGVDDKTPYGTLPLLDAPTERAAPSGRRFKHHDAPLNTGTLTVGPEGAAAFVRRGYLTRRFDDLAAVMAYPDGARCLVGRDGYQLQVEPTVWRAGAEAVTAIDDCIDARIYVPMPARRDESIPKPTVTTRQRVRYFRTKYRNTVTVTTGFLLAMLLIVLSVALKTPQVGALSVVVCLFTYGLVRRSPRRVHSVARHDDEALGGW